MHWNVSANARRRMLVVVSLALVGNDQNDDSSGNSGNDSKKINISLKTKRKDNHRLTAL